MPQYFSGRGVKCTKLHLTTFKTELNRHVMNKKWQVAKYILFDFLAAAISWTAFFVYRKVVIEPQRFGIDIPVEFTHRYFMGLALIPMLWVLFYYITGFYHSDELYFEGN